MCVWGGGKKGVEMIMMYHAWYVNVTVEIIDTIFLRNGYGGNDADSCAGLGGGLHISFSNLDNVGGIISDTHYRLQNVNFSNNHAELGGAVFYLSYCEKKETLSRRANSVLFDDCKFHGNRAHMAGIYIARDGSCQFLCWIKILVRQKRSISVTYLWMERENSGTHTSTICMPGVSVGANHLRRTFD